MAKLKKLEETVKNVLQNYEIAREDDFMLVFLTYREINENVSKQPFDELMLFHKSFNLPVFESVSRCRRKVQKKYPELANPRTVKAREIEEQEYIEYSKK